jgi:hypothetical protein
VVQYYETKAEYNSETRKCLPDLRLIFYCFQEGLTEVGNTKHLPGTAVEEGQQETKQQVPKTITAGQR